MVRPGARRVGANVDALTDPPLEIEYPDPRKMADEMIDELIGHAGSIDEPAGLEWVATRLGLSLADASVPRDVRYGIVEALEGREGEQGALLLAAIAQESPGEAAEMAVEGAGRLRERGVEADLPRGLGAYEFVQAQLEKRKRRDYHSFSLRRPGQDSVEVGFFSTRHGKQHGVLHAGVLTKPMPADEARALLDVDEEGGGDAVAMSAGQLATALREASARTAKVKDNVDFELWFALRALARALDVEFAVLPAARLYLTEAS
jgi:hypothetical protein